MIGAFFLFWEPRGIKKEEVYNNRKSGVCTFCPTMIFGERHQVVLGVQEREKTTWVETQIIGRMNAQIIMCADVALSSPNDVWTAPPPPCAGMISMFLLLLCMSVASPVLIGMID
jgi:hypothetical protein